MIYPPMASAADGTDRRLAAGPRHRLAAGRRRRPDAGSRRRDAPGRRGDPDLARDGQGQLPGARHERQPKPQRAESAGRATRAGRAQLPLLDRLIDADPSEPSDRPSLAARRDGCAARQHLQRPRGIAEHPPAMALRGIPIWRSSSARWSASDCPISPPAPSTIRAAARSCACSSRPASAASSRASSASRSRWSRQPTR